jgi:hypothetical protein
MHLQFPLSRVPLKCLFANATHQDTLQSRIDPRIIVPHDHEAERELNVVPHYFM